MKIQHTIRNVKLGDVDVSVDISYIYTPGLPELGPSYGSGGQPAEPPEGEILKIILLHDSGKFIRGTNIISYLDDDEFDELINDIVGDNR